jgi:hypothetical protein
MALYDTRYELPQSMVDYLNQGLPSIQQPYRPGYDKDYGPKEGTGYTTVMPQPGYQYVYGPDGQRYSIPIPGYDKNLTKMPVESKPIVDSLYPQTGGNEEGFSVYNPDPNMTRTSRNYVNPFPYDPMDDFGFSDYGYIEEPRKGIPGLFDQYIKTSLPAQLLGKGFNFLKDQLPVNKAGIFQNELLGAGFMLDNTGRIVANNYNTPEGIMAGYNPVSGGALNFLTGGRKGEPATYGLDKAYDKRRDTVAKTLKEKYGMTDEEIEAAIAGEYEGDVPINPITGKPTDLINRLDLFNQSQNLVNKKKSAAEIIFDRKVEERRDPITIADRKSAIDQEASNRDAVREAAKKSAARKSAVAQETSNRDYARNAGRDRARDSAQSSATGRGATSATSSGLGGLGFSDIRLKENIELIGKSPSNINIYKFNYKNNPTTYQGAMAHEVPWASVKHSNGYMMVDYNLLDVDFKKYNA